jgi:hypothetical protein
MFIEQALHLPPGVTENSEIFARMPAGLGCVIAPGTEVSESPACAIAVEGKLVWDRVGPSDAREEINRESAEKADKRHGRSRSIQRSSSMGMRPG